VSIFFRCFFSLPMEGYVRHLRALLNERRLPPGVASPEALQEWFLQLPVCLSEWATLHETALFPPVHEHSPTSPNLFKVSPAFSPRGSRDASPGVPSGEGAVLGQAYSVDDPCLQQEWEAVRRDAEPTNWVLLGLKGPGGAKTKPEVELVGRGTGGLRELRPYLDDARVLFGGFRVTAIDDKTGVVSSRSKFVTVVWVGEKLGAMTKAKVTMQRADFARILHGAHLNLQVSDATELTPECIEGQLQANAGAHKPSRYEF